MNSWMKSRKAFCQLTMLPLLCIALWGILRNDQVFYNHFQEPGRVVLIASVLVLLLAVGMLWAWRHHREWLPDADKLWCIFGLAAAYSLIGNVELYNPGGQFLVSAFCSFGVLCLLWALLKHYALLFWIPFAFVEMVQHGAFRQYGMHINRPPVLAEMFEASYDEVMVYLTPLNVSMMVLVLLLSFGLAWAQKSLLRRVPRLPLANMGILSLLLAGGALAVSFPEDKSEYNLWPVYEACMIPANIHGANLLNDKTEQYVRGLPSPADMPSSLSTLSGQEGVVLVLHIGESVRADRLSLNGYTNKGRSTTPWLCGQQAAGALINYSDCISAAPHTCTALISLLTDARRQFTHPNEDYGARAGSVLDLFSANGFSVYSFFGTRERQVLKYDTVISALSSSSVEHFNAPGNPHSILPTMGGVLRDNPQQNMVLFINNEGSHVPFGYYEAETAPFLPAQPCLSNPVAHAEAVNNAYDNTIHYTDEFIRRLVEKLEGRPFIYIYVSDHGEYLGHDGLWGRGGVSERYHSTSGSRVGMFVITSPEFEALHPHFASAVQNLREHAAMTVGHEHLYHTLLGVVGIESPYYSASLDLSSEAPEPYTGPQPGQD